MAETAASVPEPTTPIAPSTSLRDSPATTTTTTALHDLDNDLSTSRKRKIDSLLSLIDHAKFPSPSHSPLPTPPTPSSPLSPSKHQPSFQPWSRTSLTHRLLTFRTFHFPIHDPLSPLSALHLSRHGWSLVSTEVLRCDRCRERVKLDLHAIGGLGDAMVRRFGRVVEAAHGDGCPWIKRPCDALILRLFVDDVSLQSFRVRVSSFSRVEGLRRISHSVEKLVVERGGGSGGGIEMECVEKYALFGWTCEWSEQVPLLTCQTCHRRILIDSNNMTTVRTITTTPGPEPEVEEDQEQEWEEEGFDALGEHYGYCPWIHAPSQTAERGGKSGWEWVFEQYRCSRLKATKEGMECLGEAEGRDAEERGEKDPRDLVRQVKKKLGFL